MILAIRNRAESLRETLEALAQQETAGQVIYEVLVVDNAFNGSTRPLVTALQGTFPVPLHDCHERRVGQPWALNAGLQQAQGRFFAFTDDDILPPASWLWTLRQCFQETPECSVCWFRLADPNVATEFSPCYGVN